MSATDDLGRVIAILASLLLEPGPAECRNCGSTEIRAKDLCPGCYERWRLAGRGDTVPPRVRRPKRTGSQRGEFLAIRALGATVPQAAKHARIPEHTGWAIDAAASRSEPARRSA